MTKDLRRGPWTTKLQRRDNGDEGGVTRVYEYDRGYCPITKELYLLRSRNERPDCTNRMGQSPIQKVMAVVRVYGYACCFDSVDKVIKMGGTSVKRATIEFCETIVNVYKSQYLRDPTPNDIACLLAKNKVRGFPRMIGSLDLFQDLWIWHAFFGMPGSNNDVTILDHSLLFDKYINGTTPPVEYEVNGTVRHVGRTSNGRSVFSNKNGELCMLWHARTTERSSSSYDMYNFHNMVFEDERGKNLPEWVLAHDKEQSVPYNSQSLDEVRMLYRIRMGQLRNTGVNARLQEDLINYYWWLSGGETIV
ncbi:uncharacterized protein LOC127265893 [Andrographis paniculata]|uniref:uncharacterized protein LOC127265893 n=1 Tax=Andrographis paniculata TaxID=175694 RepID=UPI0021E6EC6B|nr:uncharacterized protein LOC127265893 [Andrographis paniculata]